MADNVISIIIRAKDEASAALKSTAQSMSVLEDAAKTAAIPFAGLAAAGTALMGKTVLTAARTEELGIVIENLGRVSGYSEKELYQVEKSITELGITTQGAREIMARFMGAELDLADASKIARAAQDLAVIGMEDSSTAAENLTYAIASMQPRVLRQYGLFLNLNDVYEQVAETLGKDVQALTEAEKRQGMLNAVLEQAGNFAGTYEAAMETAGKQLRSLSRHTEKAAEELGEHYLPYLGMAVDAAGDAFQAFSKLDDATQGVIASGIMYATVIAGSIAATMGAVVATSKLIAALQALKLVMATHPLLILPTALAVLATAALQSKAAFDEQKASLRELAKTQEEYVKGVKELIPATEKAATGFRGYHHDAMEAARETAALTAKQEWAADQTKKYADAYVESYKMIAEAAKESAHVQAEAINEAQGEIRLALGTSILDLRENMEAYEELQNTVTTVYADTAGITQKFNDWRTTQEATLQDKLADLEVKRAEKIAWVRTGDWQRTVEESEAAHAHWNGIYDAERDKLIGTVNEKITARETETQADITAAQTAAAERSRITEEEKEAQLQALREAQEERVILFALEMLEYKNQLQVPIKGFDDMKITAEEYFDLLKSGIIELTPEMQNNLGVAIQTLDTSMAGAGDTSRITMEDLMILVQDAAGDVMHLGTTTDTEIDNMRRAHIERLKPAMRESEEAEDDLTASIEDTGTEMDDLKETSRRAHAAMQTHTGSSIRKMDDYTDSIGGAISAFKRLSRLEGGAPVGFEPGLQAGLAYVPATMRTIIHRGEAVLTSEEAAKWRMGQGGPDIHIHMSGDMFGINGVNEAVKKVMEDMGRYTR